MKSYELIIFDCDGTLVDSEPLTNGLISDLINERGIEMTKARSLDLFAGKTIVHINDFIREYRSDHDDVAFEEEYRERCLEKFNAELEAIDGVKELLESLTVPFCVASNGPKVKMATTLPASGLDQYFDEKNTFSAYDINKWKPEPDLFRYAAKQMGVDYSKALVIEDTWSGVMGAINGQIDVWAYNAHLDPRVFLSGVPNFKTMSALHNNLVQYI